MPVGGLAIGAAAIGAAAGIGKSIFGGKELKKTKEELAALNMPEYQIENEYYTNERLSAALAQQGLTQQAKDYYTSQADRGLGAGISAVTRTGGSPNMVSDLLDNYNQGIQQIAVTDAEKQTGNIQKYMDTAKTLAGQKTMQWAINEYQPYQNKLKELTQRRAAAYQNLFGGIGDVASSLSGLGTGLSNTGLGTNGNGGAGVGNVATTANFQMPLAQTYSAPNTALAVQSIVPSMPDLTPTGAMSPQLAGQIGNYSNRPI